MKIVPCWLGPILVDVLEFQGGACFTIQCLVTDSAGREFGFGAEWSQVPWPVPSMVGLDLLSLAGQLSTFWVFFQRVCRLPMKRSANKRKKQSSFLKGYVTLLGTSMAAEKESSEDDYDGMWTGSLGCCCCGGCVCVWRPCWKDRVEHINVCVYPDPWVHSIQVEQYHNDWLDWLERLLRFTHLLWDGSVTCEKETRKPIENPLSAGNCSWNGPFVPGEVHHITNDRYNVLR